MPVLVAAELFGLDSNVLIYAVDATEPRRQERARLVVDLASKSCRCILSTQNVGEFYSVVTRRCMAEPDIARRKAVELMAMFPQLAVPDATAIRSALDAATEGRFSYWDAAGGGGASADALGTRAAGRSLMQDRCARRLPPRFLRSAR